MTIIVMTGANCARREVHEAYSPVETAKLHISSDHRPKLMEFTQSFSAANHPAADVGGYDKGSRGVAISKIKIDDRAFIGLSDFESEGNFDIALYCHSDLNRCRQVWDRYLSELKATFGASSIERVVAKKEPSLCDPSVSAAPNASNAVLAFCANGK